jgi:predicted MFS family arabinose efflux permease
MSETGTTTDVAAGPGPWIDPRLVVLACGMFAIGTDSFVIAGILPRIARDLSIDIGTAGQLITVYALSYALATPVAAALTSEMARQRVLRAGLCVFALGNLATALAPDIFFALAGRIASGIGAAIFAPAASATAVALTDPLRRGRALGMMMVGLSAATALGAPIGTALAEFFDWRVIIALIAILGAVVALRISWSVGDLALPRPAGLADRLRPLGSLRVFGALLATFLVLAGLYTVYSYISVVFRPATRGDGSALAVLLLLWGLGAIAGTAMAGWLTDTYGSRRVINVTLACLAVNIALIYLSSASFPASMMSVLIWGACAWAFTIPQQHRLTAIEPEHAQIMLGLYAMSVYLGAAASGVIGAVALRYFDAQSLPLIAAGLIVAGFLVSELTGYLRPEPPAPKAPESPVS